MNSKKRLIGALLLFGFLLASPNAILSQDDQLRVDSAIEDGVVYVKVESLIQAPHELIWGVLTDYNRLAEYIPGMHSSRLLRYEGRVAFVEQHGMTQFLFFKIPVDVVVKSIEAKPHSINIELVSGNLDHLSGGYHLSMVGSNDLWHLSWSGYLDPSLPIPNFIAERLIRKNVRRQFLGILTQIQNKKRQLGNHNER